LKEKALGYIELGLYGLRVLYLSENVLVLCICTEELDTKLFNIFLFNDSSLIYIQDVEESMIIRVAQRYLLIHILVGMHHYIGNVCLSDICLVLAEDFKELRGYVASLLKTVTRE